MHIAFNRGGLRSFLIILGLLAGQMTPTTITAGTPLLLIGIAINLWSKGCLAANREMAASGPYTLVRHPFYFGNIFLDCAIAVMSGWLPLLIFLPFWWFGVYIPVMRREESVLIDKFGELYTAYMKQVPMIIPCRRPLPGLLSGFSWSNKNIRKTEMPRMIRSLTYPLMFVIAYRLYAEGMGVLSSSTPLDVLTVASLASLWALYGVFRLHFKYKKTTILPSWILTAAARSVILLGICLLGFMVRWFEIENDWLVWSAGLLLLSFSIIMHKFPQRKFIIKEAFLAIGFAVLFELFWLAVILIPLYVMILLEPQVQEKPYPPSGSSFSLFWEKIWARSHNIVLLTGIALACLKEYLY